MAPTEARKWINCCRFCCWVAERATHEVALAFICLCKDNNEQHIAQAARCSAPAIYTKKAVIDARFLHKMAARSAPSRMQMNF